MSSESDTGFNRRTALGFIGGAVAATQVGVLSTARAGEMLDLNDRKDFLTALAKMRGSTDERVTMGYVLGRRYALVDNLATPIWDILAGTFFRYKRLDDENFEIRSIEVAYFLDLETGKLLETWENPFTNEVIEIPQTRMGPSILNMTADGLSVPNPVGEASGMEIKDTFSSPRIVGDNVWVTEEIRVDSGPESETGHPRFVYNENSSYHSTLTELSDPENTWVPSHVHFSGSVTFRPWMGFGDVQGHTISRGDGRHIARAEDFDPYYLELTEQYHPDVLNDINGVLDNAK